MSKSKQRTPADWSKIVKRSQRSTLSQSDFCRKEGISVQQLHYWRKKEQNTETPTPSPFIPLPIETSPPVTTEMEIELPGGIVIRLRGAGHVR